ncbi:hypothetical protein [Alteromonas sp. W364]|uniref:hypothetical protein n=1 Tax=Alteromonas sp. W364 TaxID=3075610 RepID=UPI002888820E|nr:hypothetical protein [Alteromonas sp. W364]MDT0627465.1 hypothetical protein [Alteromonas sp. W364]
MYESLISNMAVEDIYVSQVFDYYHACFVKSDWCQSFVADSPRIPGEFRNTEVIGLCDRTIHTIVPVARTLEGGAIRGGLQHCGLITARGGELFRGCLVFPKFDSTGKIIEATGFRYGKRIRHWQSLTVHWNRPNSNVYLAEGMALAEKFVHAKA